MERSLGDCKVLREHGGMASERKNATNRSNAKRSTGPRTQVGKARSSRNARQHGLSRVDLKGDVNISTKASAISAGIGQHMNASEVHDLICAILWLSHVREVRHGMIAAWLNCPGSKQIKRLAGLERYERPIRAAQRRVLRRGFREGEEHRERKMDDEA